MIGALAYTIVRPVVDHATFLRCPRWCDPLPADVARSRLAAEPEALAALDSVPGAVAVRCMVGDRDGAGRLRLSVMVLAEKLAEEVDPTEPAVTAADIWTITGPEAAKRMAASWEAWRTRQSEYISAEFEGPVEQVAKADFGEGVIEDLQRVGDWVRVRVRWEIRQADPRALALDDLRRQSGFENATGADALRFAPPKGALVEDDDGSRWCVLTDFGEDKAGQILMRDEATGEECWMTPKPDRWTIVVPNP